MISGPLVAGLPIPRGGSLTVVAATDYDGAARRALLAYKERGRRDLARPLAAMLAQAVRGLLGLLDERPSTVLLVGVPSTRRAAVRRGGDHVLRLARRASYDTGVPSARGVLALRGDVLDSAGLSAADRASNLSSAMVAVARPARAVRRVIVVDDVVSSGTTLSEARRALIAAGWDVAGAAALAATPAAGSGAAVLWDRRFFDHPLAAHGRRV